MHAIVPPYIWNQFGGIINTGDCYFIRNIHVSPSTGFFRPVRSTRFITFIHCTVVVVDPHDYAIIPTHKFELLPLRDMYNHTMLNDVNEFPLYSTGNHFNAISIHNVLYIFSPLTVSFQIVWELLRI